MKYILPLALLFLGSACAPPVVRQMKFESSLNAWLGRPIKDYIAKHGQPMNVEALPGGEAFYIFTRSQPQYDPWGHSHQQVLQGGWVEPTEWLNSIGAQNRERRVRRQESERNLFCTVLLRASSEGLIHQVSYEGNDCW